ncbi:Fibronectin type III domain-containing protein [Geodermatophilus obscurus]|uniref:Fibronectin type III domain-containing protein n=1 Tax=Geodermatophilus obscurus TaxID=1861 RepID=A0A1M7TLJ5_9ACTN|nr:fibronectin type III domain-containing protein [Geodermatophilus obscurus]SHN71493.1 Fibronectin type III domain-containing protein [Geodermatophilus obscurus]
MGAPASRASRSPKRLIAGGLAALTVTGAAVTLGGIAQAGNPPLGPGNIEVFPKRDMVALEGYTDQAGETATVTVKRNGQQIGIGEGVIDATGFLEFNHPGGSCWTGVTPNISGGDLVEVRFSETAFTDGAYVSSAKITSVTHSDFAATPAEGDVEGTVTISGTYGDDFGTRFDLSRFVVEVVNPEMRRPDPSTPPTLIGERAIGWTPVVDPAEPNGGPGYEVTGSAEGGAFSVTFGMYSAADAERVLDGEHVVTSWMQDAGELALGNSLYEFGETDGPGFGGCPAGPASQAPVPPTSVDATRSGTDVTLTWTTPAQPVDANPVTQYRVAAVDGVHGQEIAVRQGAGEGTNSATIHGLVEGQAYGLILEANNGRWSPVVQLGTLNADGTITPATDPTNPDTTGGGTGGDTGGDTGETPTEPVVVAPTAPSLTRVLAGHESVTAEWTAAQPGNATSAITGYEIVATPSAAADGTVGTPVTAQIAATATSGTVTGLVNGVDYTVQVFALAGEQRTGSTTASGVNATVKANDVVTVARAQYRADKREYRISGTAGDTTANRVHLRIGDVAGTGSVIQLNVPVAADGTWSVDLRNGPVLPTTNRFNVTSDSGASSVAAMTRSR